jgi:tRNA(fMet)-specific endonuclease VapC
MLDTKILIYLMKRRPKGVADRVNGMPEGTVLCMSFVTYAELLKGAERSTRKQDVLQRLALLIRQVHVAFPADADICRHYAEQSSRLKAAGTPIGGNDLWIAAHALAIEAVLVTNNLAEFERISGLTLEDWSAAC